MPSRSDHRSRKPLPKSSVGIAAESHSLTPREIQVVELIVAGKRNSEIGTILKCSPRTVQKHVQHILRKLNLETRVHICIWGYERRRNADRSDRDRQK
jgi:DNA-binding CsgD family transcriptional regulator